MKRELTSRAGRYPPQVKKTTYAAADLILSVSDSRVPIDTSDLRNSGRVEMQKEGRLTVAAVLYGGIGRTDEYAVVVHEDMDAYHPVGQAKFLESAMKDSQKAVTDKIITDLHIERI